MQAPQKGRKGKGMGKKNSPNTPGVGGLGLKG